MRKLYQVMRENTHSWAQICIMLHKQFFETEIQQVTHTLWQLKVIWRGCTTCRSRGCSGTACMACGRSRVWCRGTAPLCNLGIKHTARSFVHSKQLADYLPRKVVLPRGPGSVGSVSNSDSDNHTENRFTSEFWKRYKPLRSIMTQQVYLTSLDGPLPRAEPAAGRFQEESQGSPSLDALGRKERSS